MYREGCLPVREIARLSGVARSTVRDMLARFERSGLSWPVPAEIGDADLEARLYGPAGVKPGRRKQAEPDWSVVARELKRKHVTLQVLWEEYIAVHPDGYRYSRWCELFRNWEGRLSLVMRQSHAGGEKVFVDYAGDTVPVVINRRTGEIRDAHLFVAVLGGSSLSFACATWTEQFADWIEGHNAAFAFFGGVAQLLVPDNAKVAVIKACHFDPMLNRSYTDMARHYRTAVLPARPRRPRDKAKVEACVGIVERWILGRLRNRVFYSLAEINAGIAECLTDLNETRILRQFGRTRRQLFEEVDAPNLKPLPAEPWVHAQWKRCRVAARSRPASPRAPSRSFSAANASRCTCVAAEMAGIRRCPSICPRATGAIWNGRRRRSAMRRPGSGRCCRCWSSASSTTDRIPNRATARALASLASPSASAPIGLRLLRCARWRSRRAIIPPSNRSSKRGSTRCPCPKPRSASRSYTTISGAPNTTTERSDDAQTPDS